MSGKNAEIARWRMAKHRRAYPNQGHSLEWFMENYIEYCEVCHLPLIVHSFRRANGKWKKAVYSHCENKSCRNQMMVICVYPS